MNQDLVMSVQNMAYLPKRAHITDAGLDLYTTEDTVIKPGSIAMLGTGVKACIPFGYMGMIVVRSGIGCKHNVTLGNSVGIIDSDYRNEMKVPLANHGTEDFVVTKGMRIAQLIIVPILLPNIEIDPDYDNFDRNHPTDRGLGGFGSTGQE